MTTDLPPFVRDLLASPPHRGEGLNNWFFRCARVLHPFRSHDEIVELLRAATHGSPLQRDEIERAVTRSRDSAWKPGEPPSEHVVQPPAWPKVDYAKRAKVIAETGVGLVDLWERSPVRFDDDLQHSEEIVDFLFPNNPLLCCDKSRSRFDTKLREEWRGQLSSLALIVPSAMTARKGLTQENKMSAHALSSTGPRQYLIVEQDQGTVDEQATILVHLSEYAPLVLAVHSGNRSLHGWLSCSRANASEQAFEKFMRYAVSLGADKALWLRSQFARMPDGRHENGKWQTVFYFNPSTLSLEKDSGHGPEKEP
jgi:hypothetical protein